jgi:hypothetical protein
MSYLNFNKAHWEIDYKAVNVDHPIFRFYGRILKPQFGIHGGNHELLLDFGCGQGLREVNFKTNRNYDLDKYFVNFTEDEDDLKENFSLFEPVHIGFYSDKFRSDEQDSHHYIFCGIKAW